MGLTKQEEKVLASIVVPSTSDPTQPEFPPGNPHWPSTPIRKVKVPGRDNIFLKDESVNPTGTHKDRMAWEMVVTYRELLLAKKSGRLKMLPHMSLISSGSAALAIQTMLRHYGLPALKVLQDQHVDANIKKSLEAIGCEVYEVDLTKRVLHAEDILRLTNNKDGIDITSDETLGPFDIFYDWMSYEILNENPDYVFVPYGTGHLFENLVNVAKRESAAFFFHDKRFQGNAKKIRRMHFLGATTNNPHSIADKLYSPHLPFVHFDTRWIDLAKRKGYIGDQSDVQVVREKFLLQAMVIAQQNTITCEPSGIAGLGFFLQIKHRVPVNAKVLIVNTGKAKMFYE